MAENNPAYPTFTQRQVDLVQRYYLESDLQDLAEVVGLKVRQLYGIAKWLGLRRRKPYQRREMTEGEMRVVRKMAYRQLQLTKESYKHPIGTTLDFVMVTGNVCKKQLSKLSIEKAEYMTQNIWVAYPRCIEIYITLPSKANNYGLL